MNHFERIGRYSHKKTSFSFLQIIVMACQTEEHKRFFCLFIFIEIHSSSFSCMHARSIFLSLQNKECILYFCCSRFLSFYSTIIRIINFSIHNYDKTVIWNNKKKVKSSTETNCCICESDTRLYVSETSLVPDSFSLSNVCRSHGNLRIPSCVSGLGQRW